MATCGNLLKRMGTYANFLGTLWELVETVGTSWELDGSHGNIVLIGSHGNFVVTWRVSWELHGNLWELRVNLEGLM